MPYAVNLPGEAAKRPDSLLNSMIAHASRTRNLSACVTSIERRKRPGSSHRLIPLLRKVRRQTVMTTIIHTTTATIIRMITVTTIRMITVMTTITIDRSTVVKWVPGSRPFMKFRKGDQH